MPSEPVSSDQNAFDHVTLSAGEKSVTLPVERGTLGNPCIDIARLPKETGCFTYDAGFTATGIVASGAHDSASRRNLHRTLAIYSMSVALAGDLLMLVWKD